MIHLYVNVFFLYILNLGPVSDILPPFSVQEECWSPGAASGGGQLHPTWEESRTLLVECSGWLGWTALMSIVGEMWMHDILDCIYHN